MKKALTIVIALAMVAAMFVPLTASAKDGDLLFKVDWIADKSKFVTVDNYKGTSVKFEEQYDLSKITSDMLIYTKLASVPSKNDSNPCLNYFEETGYKLAADKNYTVYFEAANPHNGKYAGVVFMREAENRSGPTNVGDHKGIVMLGGHFSDGGDYDDAATNTPWTETFFAYDRAQCDDNHLGEGYDTTNIKYRLNSHPALTNEDLPEGFTDDCGQGGAASKLQFSTWKVEIKGLDVSAWYLDAENKWNKATSSGNEVTYTAQNGSDIVLGVSCREAQPARHLYCRNLKLLQGVGLTYDQIKNAQPAAEGSETQTGAAPATGDNAIVFVGIGIAALAVTVATVVVKRRRFE